MKKLTLVWTAASALFLLPSVGSARTTDHGAAIVVAQAMTGGAGSNSPAAGGGPKSEVAPGPSVDDASGKRTSKDFGTSNPLAGDEQDDKRPSSGPAQGGQGTMPRPSPGAMGD